MKIKLIHFLRYLLNRLHESLLEDVVKASKHNGIIDLGEFYSDVGYHVAYGNLPKDIIETLTDDEDEEPYKVEWMVLDLIDRLKSESFRHGTISAEHLKEIVRMEREDKDKSGPYIFPIQ